MMNPLGSLNNFVFDKNAINTDSQNTFKKPNLEIKDSQDSNVSSKQNIDNKKDPKTDYSKNNFEDELQNEEDSLKPKDQKKTPSFKNKLEDLNSAIDIMLMSLQPAPVQAEPDAANIDLSLNIDPTADSSVNATILTTLGDKLSDQSESLIKDIANIDLSSEDAIQDILKLSDNLEQINALQAKVAELAKQLNLKNAEADTNLSEPELNLLLDDKLEKFIDKYVTDSSGTNKHEECTTGPIDNSDGSIAVLRTEDLSDSETQDQDPNSTNHDNDRFILNELSSRTKSTETVDNNPTIIKETVNVNKLTKFLTDRIVKIDSGKREEILMKLTPGDMGEVKLSIARQGDKLEIKMEFSSQDSLDTVEHRLNELQTSLRAKGFDTEIKVSATDSSELNSNQQSSQNSSSNEARDEQKEKYLHSMPSWLRSEESHIKTSFQDALGGILE